MDGLAKVQPNPNPQFTYTHHQDLNVSYNPTPTNVFFFSLKTLQAHFQGLFSLRKGRSGECLGKAGKT